MVHVDYTTKSGAERLDALVPKEEAQRLKRTPFAAVQVTSSPHVVEIAPLLILGVVAALARSRPIENFHPS